MLNWTDIIKSKTLQPDEVDYVIYHHPCSDGTGSGYVAWKYLSTKYPTREVMYKPMGIGADPPDDIDGKNVLICDYSYRKDKLIKLLLKVNKLLVIDHHKSSQIDLKDIDEKFKIFDMNHSGAMLTWFYFFPNIEPPLMIKYIEDRDIWAKKLPLTDEFTAWFYTLPLDFQVYDKYNNDELIKEMINTKGTNFIELNNSYIKQAVNYAVPKFIQIKDKYYFVAFVNSTIVKSDVGNKLLEHYPYIDFSAVYSISDSSNCTSFSLRSDDTHLDVSILASSLGGGGHRNASGVVCHYICNHLPGKMFDCKKLYYLLENLYFSSLMVNDQIYNIVYLYAPLYKYKLGSYLLQERYKDKNNNSIQNCQAISNKKNNLNECVPIKYHIAAVWEYDPLNDTTHFTLVFDKSVNSDDKDKIFSKIPHIDKIITLKGINKTLPTLM